jgi:monoamine oxidase
MHCSVVIVGGGLSGLRCAQLLNERGIDFILLEGRSRLGGRIFSLPISSVSGANASQRYDLGPAWYWPAMQPHMASLVSRLGLSTFPQYSSGALAIERFRLEPVRYARGYDQEPASIRLAGGMQALVGALVAQLPKERLHLSTRVTAITQGAARVQIEAIGDQETQIRVNASRVILALPPRLAARTISFAPDLPSETKSVWAATPTWMAGHAKLVAVYEHAFWREARIVRISAKHDWSSCRDPRCLCLSG